MEAFWREALKPFVLKFEGIDPHSGIGRLITGRLERIVEEYFNRRNDLNELFKKTF